MKNKSKEKVLIVMIVAFICVVVAFCGIIFWLLFKQSNEMSIDGAEKGSHNIASEESQMGSDADEQGSAGKSGLANESAKDAEIDFTALQQENPDVFAWIYIPGTDIDYPVLQSEESDSYYESHNAYGKEDKSGAIYTELANLKSMCDFNTVIHGKTLESGEAFTELYRYADLDFMSEHENIYLYIEGNLLTYEVFAAYEREDTSLIRTYDFTYISGCQQFLDDLYNTRVMGKNIKEGWDEVTPYHFLITLTTQSEDKPGKQYVVVAALVQDAAGNIDRVVME